MNGRPRNSLHGIVSMRHIVIFLLCLEEEGKGEGSQHLLCTCHAHPLWCWEVPHTSRVDLSLVRDM